MVFLEAKLTINGFDFTPYIPEGGIRQEPISRLSKSVVTLDGTEHRRVVEKRALSVSLFELPDGELRTLHEALYRNGDLATVDYTDRSGRDRTGIRFYVSDFSAAEKVVRGGVTWWSDLSFQLEEK